MDHNYSAHAFEPKAFWSSRYSVSLIVMGVIAAYFLLNEHRAHFFDALPFLFLLACPLMHLFMHHGHDRHGDGEGHSQDGGQHPNIPAPSQTSKIGEQS